MGIALLGLRMAVAVAGDPHPAKLSARTIPRSSTELWKSSGKQTPAVFNAVLR
jgi:hypothetical protein